MENLANYKKEERPWGEYERFTLNEATTVKLIEIRVGESLSLQTHQHRDEFWRVLKGSGVVRIGETDNNAPEGKTFFIPRGSEHRAIGGPDGLTILEISFGELDENDITRIEDKYGRV